MASMVMGDVLYGLSGAVIADEVISTTTVARGLLDGEWTAVRVIERVTPEVMVAYRVKEDGVGRETRAAWGKWRMAFPYALGLQEKPQDLHRRYRRAKCPALGRADQPARCP
ncbi:MAG: hypothetical protein M3493_10125 [Actinomycetota bacterium]|nr:hypothetical protein [Euzebyaceae bacterium]MDQ3453034.1 hypothetical protein [Actinomycetota bacterium]